MSASRDDLQLASQLQSLDRQKEVFAEAMRIYAMRNTRYKDNWRRFGWRGCLFRVRERAERAWDDLFWAELPETDYSKFSEAHVDDLLDLINLAAFAVRAIREGNRDGNWFEAES